ncbi:penicillin-binding protein activator [Skermanella mucosa]|uniref:penicillin-binding protein activator n=1 Tax=Skermanella mucosa TaxID=1789672 RepID=UPI001E642DF2|nr:penicillin-binding protein activator [Skermanella mucosa]UEM21068.1 penicillin-binding protein activator [Skermanella mucosa]
MTRLATFPDILKPVWLAAGLLALAACAPTVRPEPPQVQAEQAPITTEPLEPVTPVNRTVKVALLVPLTGNAADLGQGMLEAAQMALFDLGDDSFQLIPRDTKGTPGGASEAARAAIADGAQLILGPLYSSSVGAVRPAVQGAGLSMVSFSNNLSQAGSGAWTIGFSPENQVRRVVSYARSQGVSRIGSLAPRDAYGDAVSSALNTAALDVGARIVRTERYDPSATDLSPAVQSLASGGPGSLDAIMLAEGGPKLRSAASLLPAFQIDPAQVKLLGTGMWDDPTLGSEPALVGGWYAAPDPAARRDFEQRFESVYGRRPPRLATLAYDAAALAAVLARNGGPAPFDMMALTNPNGFAGVDGIFRLRPDGLVDRGLAVMEVTPDGNRVIDPAPSSFQSLGF